MPNTLCLAFDRKNPRAVKYARTLSSSLVTLINEDTLASIRAVVGLALNEGLAPRKSAVLIRDLVGLTERDATAVLNLRARLQRARPGSLVMAGKKRIRIGPNGISNARLEALSQQYATKLHRARALTIARTETARSANAGLRESWLQAIETGQLSPMEKRVWLVTEIGEWPRPTHEFMKGQVRGIAEPFVKEDGAPIEPGEEPNCRCSQGIASEADIEAAKEIPHPVVRYTDGDAGIGAIRVAGAAVVEPTALHGKGPNSPEHGGGSESRDYSHFDTLPPDIEGVPIIKKPLGSMVAMGGADGIAINSSRRMRTLVWKDMAAYQKRAHEAGWSSSPHPNHVLWHELAHARLKQELTPDRDSYLKNMHALFDAHFGQVAGKVSQYAKSNGHEFLAEVFAGRRAGRVFDADVLDLYARLGGPKP